MATHKRLEGRQAPDCATLSDVEPGEPTGTGGDQAGTGRQRFSVAEAAMILETTLEDVRGRIGRGTLESVKEGGTVYVFLAPDESADRTRPADDQPSDRSRPDPLLDELWDRIAFLEGQLQSREEEIRRRDAILMNMTEAMKAIGPPREADEEAPESPEMRADEQRDVAQSLMLEALMRSPQIPLEGRAAERRGARGGGGC